MSDFSFDLTAPLTKKEDEAQKMWTGHPTRLVTAMNEAYKDGYGSPQMGTGSPDLDRITRPIRPGMVRMWMSVFGMGKSTVLKALAMADIKRIIENGTQDKEYVAHIGYEEYGETLTYAMIPNRDYSVQDILEYKVPPEKFEKDTHQMLPYPYTFYGLGEFNRDMVRGRMTIKDALHAIVGNYKKNKRLPCRILVDYIQVAAVGQNFPNRTAAITQAYDDIEELGRKLGVPVEIASQAGKHVFNNDLCLPGSADAEWANHLGEKATAIVGFSRPINDKRNKENTVKVQGKLYQKSPNLLVFTALKNRHGAATDEIVPLLLLDNLTFKRPQTVGLMDDIDF